MKFTPSRQILLASFSFASLLLSAAVVEAKAGSDVNYNYAGIQLVDQNIDKYDCGQSGLSLNGSLDVDENFFAVGSYTDVGGSDNCGSATLSLGGGYHALFNASASIYGALSYENTSVDYGKSDSGLIAAVGLRSFLTPKFEGKVEVAHHTAFDGNTLLNAGAAFWFKPKFAVTGDVSLGSESTSVAIGLRLNF